MKVGRGHRGEKHQTLPLGVENVFAKPPLTDVRASLLADVSVVRLNGSKYLLGALGLEENHLWAGALVLA